MGLKKVEQPTTTIQPTRFQLGSGKEGNTGEDKVYFQASLSNQKVYSLRDPFQTKNVYSQACIDCEISFHSSLLYSSISYGNESSTCDMFLS